MKRKNDVMGRLDRIKEWLGRIPVLGRHIGLRYPVTAYIREDRDDGSANWVKDQVMRFTDGSGTSYSILKKRGHVFEPIDYSKLNKFSDGSQFVFLRSPVAGRYQAVSAEVKDEGVQYSQGEEMWTQWGTLESMRERESWEAEKKWWQEPRLQAAFMMIAAGVFIMFVTYSGVWWMKQSAGDMQAAGRIMREAATIIARNSGG